MRKLTMEASGYTAGSYAVSGYVATRYVVRRYTASSDPERNFFIDLQWFAAEDEGRTEDPTDYKIRKAREEGRVAKSQDINAALVLLFPASALIFLSSFFLEECMEILRFFFVRSTQADIRSGMWFGIFVQYFLKLALPLALIAMLAGVIANIIQNNGFLFSTKPIQPQFNKIVPNFIRFFKRALFSTEGLFNFAKSLTKVIVLVFVAFLMIRANLPHFIELLTVSFPQAVFFTAGLAAKLLATAALLLLILAIPDYFFQRKQFIDSLKMTKQEIKDEYKELEGDPQVKGRIRQQMQAILSQNAIRNVPKADVVITNPTHFAIAMQWDSKTMAAPMVLAKGADAMAQRIKAIAREHNIPLIENKPLARALYAKVQIGDIIPEEYYRALSLVFAEVYTLNNKKQDFYRR